MYRFERWYKHTDNPRYGISFHKTLNERQRETYMNVKARIQARTSACTQTAVDASHTYKAAYTQTVDMSIVAACMIVALLLNMYWFQHTRQECERERHYFIIKHKCSWTERETWKWRRPNDCYNEWKSTTEAATTAAAVMLEHTACVWMKQRINTRDTPNQRQKWTPEREQNETKAFLYTNVWVSVYYILNTHYTYTSISYTRTQNTYQKVEPIHTEIERQNGTTETIVCIYHKM